MKLELSDNKDFWAGMLLIVTGAGAILIARDYRFGSALNMGPGFFPTALGVVLIAFGVCIMIVGLVTNEKIQGHLSFRAMIILAISLVLFGILMETAGFVPAMFTLVFLSAFAGREFRLAEALVLSAALTLVTTAVFTWGLGLPYPLIRGF